MAQIFSGVPGNSLATEQVLRSILTDITALKTAVDTQKTLLDELKSWATTLATKLNADAGVTDTDYDATISAAAPTAVGTLETTT